MNGKILVTYTTLSGTTREVAEAIRDELSQGGKTVELRPLEEVAEINAYDAVVLGAPMVLGWHKDAVKFVVRHQDALSKVPVAYFLMALKLTKTPDKRVGGVPIYCDPSLVKTPQKPNQLSFKEKQTTPAKYLGPVLQKAPKIKPVSVGFFGGKLDYSTLAILPKLFVKFIIRREEGDFRNWEAIRSWAASLNLG